MILIISQSSQDFPSDSVYNWLKYLGEDCKRINGVDLIQDMDYNISLSSSNTSPQFLQWSSPDLDLSKVSAVWIRRWMNFDDFGDTDLNKDPIKEIAQSVSQDNDALYTAEDMPGAMLSLLSENVNTHLKNEFKGVSHYFFELLKDTPTLGSGFYAGKDPNKAQQLLFAQEAGLSIPSTIITGSRETIKEFYQRHSRIICKNIADIGFFNFCGKLSASYTILMEEEEIDKLPAHFYPSLFQEAIEKEFEIRVFYLYGELYSMAIFSTQDDKTAIDFRRYNHQKPNRTSPFLFPREVQDKIRDFMQKCQLDTGSLDLIYTKDKQYVFLEVNPAGQFGMVSHPCNYHLEKKVAQCLIKISKNGYRQN